MAAKPEPERIKIQEGLEVERKDILTKLLIEERKSVLFVGEGDFSFTVAFAALRKAEGQPRNRGTWDGITATRKEWNQPKPKFSNVLRVCKKECNSVNTTYLDELEEPPQDSWKYGIDG